MDDTSLLKKFQLEDIKALYKQVSELHYLKLAGKYYKDNEDVRKFSLGKENPLSLCDIAKTQKEDYSFIKLNEEQKKGISGVYGNPTKVRRECPFRTENEKLLGVSKQGHSSKRIKDETYPELTQQRKLQQITTALIKKTWTEYNGENPFKPRLTKNTLKDYNMLNYLDIIKKPISLTDINKKVKDDAYDSIEDYEADIDLMVDNARVYHGEMSLIADLGRRLLSYYYDLKKQYFG